MAEKLDPKEVVSSEELLMSEVIQSEALINLLDRKGIITKQELLEEMTSIQTTLPKHEGLLGLHTRPIVISQIIGYDSGIAFVDLRSHDGDHLLYFGTPLRL